MRIGELARRTGTSVRMLRYYEQQGLLKPERAASGYRDYADAEIQTARRIRLLSASGLKLEAIRMLLPCMQDEPLGFDACDSVRTALRHELARLDGKLQSLMDSHRIIAGYLHGLDSPSTAPHSRHQETP